MTFDLSSYQTVEERLREFWERHPYGRVNTELLSPPDLDGYFIVKAIIWRGDEVSSNPPAATGLAHDSVDMLPANMKASALEVAETSAIGRALANLGLAPKGARPSREEMQGEEAAAPPPPTASLHTAPLPVAFLRVVEVTGSRAKAREAINRVCDLEYTAKTVVETTDEEADITIAALAEAALPTKREGK